MFSDIESAIAALLPKLRDIRHDLHQHPELGFEEHRTQAIVRTWLEEHGYAPRVCAETGLVADLRPGASPTIALRADLDCLAMPEETDLPYRSVHDGRAHKCGHDGHTTILMGVARLLAARRDDLPGNVRLLFQPAEEGARGGGAVVMVAEGALDGVRECYGLHNWPAFPKGEVRVAAGPMMAQVDELELKITGVGGHGAMPQTCRDPIAAAAQVIDAIQATVARGVGSRGVAVVSICSIHSGTTHNVIPREVDMLGTIRTFDPALREDLLVKLRIAIESTAAAHGCTAVVDVLPEYPVLVNAAACADAVVRVGAAVVGGERVVSEGLPIAASEDFSYFANTVPSAYFFLGAGAPVGVTPGCHHPDFDFDDELLATGMRMFTGLVADRLPA